MLWTITLWIGVAGLVTSTAFVVLSFIGAWRFRKAQRSGADSTSDLPGVSLFKPLHGDEPELERNLDTFFRQEYPRFEILFAARREDDAGLAIARRVASKYPQVRTKFIVTGEPPYPNAKVYSLQLMLAQAAHDFFVISDSDARVGGDYIREVVEPLRDRSVGLISCVYRGVPVGGLWSRLEAMAMSVEMTSGVFVSNLLEEMRFALGPTMATRRDAVEKIGGFDALGEYCSDDFVIGQLIADAGYKVQLSQYVIGHCALNRSFKQSVRHQVRWMRSTRRSRPAGHLGTALTFCMPFALLGALAGMASGNVMAAAVCLGFGWFNRTLQAAVVGGWALRDAHTLRYCWLYPVRDLLGFFYWAASYTNSTVVWRDHCYYIERGGKMVLRETLNQQALRART